MQTIEHNLKDDLTIGSYFNLLIRNWTFRNVTLRHVYVNQSRLKEEERGLERVAVT